MLASYNSDLGKVEFFKNFRKNVVEISDEVKELFDVLQSDPTLVNWDNADGFVNFAKDIDIADETFADFLETTQKSGTVYKNAEEAIAGYQTYLKTTGKQLDLATLKTKAFTVATKALSSIGWAAIISIATKAIQAGITAIDDYIHRLDIARENLASTQEELSSIDTELGNVNKQIDEILAKDKIEIVDENELKKLRDEVGLLKEKKALLEAQEYEQQQETNKYISEQYGKYFTTAVVARPDGSIEETDALSYFKEIYDQANAYVSSQSPLSEEDKLNFESIKEGAVDLGNQLTDLLEDFKPITAEEEKQKEAM